MIYNNQLQVARSRAEEQVKALEVTDEFGLHLAELTLQALLSIGNSNLIGCLCREMVLFLCVSWPPFF